MAEKIDIKEIQKTWDTFMSQFGNDVYSNIVLEEFFSLLCQSPEAVHEKQTIPLSGPEGQTGDQNNQDDPNNERMLGNKSP